MKLSERFDRRYQQTLLATPVMPVAPSPNGPPAASATAPPAAPLAPCRMGWIRPLSSRGPGLYKAADEVMER